MSGPSEPFDAPPALDLEGSRRVFSQDTFQRLIQLVAPKLQPGKRTLVHIMPASSRFGHMVIEPWALHAIYGEEFDDIIVVIRDRRLLPYAEGAHALASTVVRFVETTNDFVIKLGHFDAPRMENGPLCIELRSAPELLKDFWRHLRAGGPARHLKLSPSLEKQAAPFLEDLGVSAHDRIVTVHMRESGYLASHRYHDFRNMTPANYEPAIRHLLDQGIWVFRLGDKGSSPLAIDHPRFVDLPFLPDHADFMDVALLSKAWFAISCSSGPEALARAFGTPVLLVNGILEQLSFRNPGDVLQFKRYIDESTGQPIPYRDILERGIVGYSIAGEFEKSQVGLEENTSDEILNAVLEMLARRTDAFEVDSDIDSRFQAANEDFLAGLEARHFVSNQVDPSESYFGMALPWTSLCQRYCRENTWFLAPVDTPPRDGLNVGYRKNT
jgi:putative glycosyltransferase (TIGR04372 family)